MAPKTAETSSAGTRPWNAGMKQQKTDRQHVFVPREDIELFYATLVYFAGPAIAVAVWLAMVTSRRISETLQCRGNDL